VKIITLMLGSLVKPWLALSSPDTGLLSKFQSLSSTLDFALSMYLSFEEKLHEKMGITQKKAYEAVAGYVISQHLLSAAQILLAGNSSQAIGSFGKVIMGWMVIYCIGAAGILVYLLHEDITGENVDPKVNERT
jgi:hypothetical protein